MTLIMRTTKVEVILMSNPTEILPASSEEAQAAEDCVIRRVWMPPQIPPNIAIIHFPHLTIYYYHQTITAIGKVWFISFVSRSKQ
jgi:hypothetical protein